MRISKSLKRFLAAASFVLNAGLVFGHQLPPGCGGCGFNVSMPLVVYKDNGNGIPQKVMDKIFQPFFTTKPTGQGTGLGLSLSYDIITKGHAGELKVETREGEGSEFIIQLPISKD